MSQQELERTDQEVMDLVNGSAAPEAAATADEIEKRMRQLDAEQEQKLKDEQAAARHMAELEAARKEEMHRQMKESEERYNRRQRRNQVLNTVLVVVLCFLISGALLMMLILPEIMMWVVSIGVVVCCTVAGIRVDRQVRKRESW